MKAKLIINPTSGKNKRKMPPLLKWTFKRLNKRIRGMYQLKTTARQIIREVQKRCDKEKIKLDVEYTKKANDAMKMAKDAKNNYDLVIVAGGDGTVNEVINGIANSKTSLVIMPFGSTNVLAMELGIPFNVKKAAELITNGKKIKMDLGYVTLNQKSRYFAICLSVGFDASLIKQISSKFKKKWGRLAYPIAGLKHLFKYEWNHIHVRHKIHSTGYFVIIANSKYYAGEYQIADKASTTDGLLDLVIINRTNWWKIIKILFSLSSGKLTKFLKGEYYQTKEAHVYSHKKMFVEVDGEVIGEAPVKVKIVPKALSVIVNK